MSWDTRSSIARSTVWNKTTGQRRNVRLRARRDKEQRYSTLDPHPHHSIDTRAGLMQALDNIVPPITKLRDKGCVTRNEDCAGELTNSHFYKRSYKVIAWDLTNNNAQCSRHNELHNHFPWPYDPYMRRKYGDAAVTRLHLLRMNRKFKLSDDQLRDMLQCYRIILHEMKTGKSFESACVVADYDAMVARVYPVVEIDIEVTT